MAKATRAAFICKDNELYQKLFTFDFYNGFSITQKRKSIESFHNVIKQDGISNILEVSRKNENEIGVMLSAFNLSITIDNKKYPVECLYQSSKVFGDVQFSECLYMQPGDAKRFVKEKVLDEKLVLTNFNLFGNEFILEPKSLFYDYLYILGLKQNNLLANQVIKYDCFTDIEYNQNKQFASQARSCALYKYLYLNNLVDEYISNPTKYNYLYDKLQINSLF